MTYALLLFAGLAAALHVFIFYLETIAWASLLAKKTFGLTNEAVTQTKEMAANQGVYNLMLALVTVAGIVFYIFNENAVGIALILAGCGSMTVAALYLFFSSDKKKAAIKQMFFPVVATVIAIFILVL